MKNPETKTTEKSSATPAATDGTTEPPAAKKPAAAAAVIDSKPVEAGSAARSAATGGAVKPADSALLGAEKTPAAAAAKKPEDKPTTLASPVLDKPAATVLPAVDKPAEKPAEKPVEKPAGKLVEKPVEKPAEHPVAATGSKPEPAKPAAAPVVHKTGFWPVALGGVVAAGVGAAAALWAFPSGLQPAPAVDPAALKQEILAEANAAAATEIAAQVGAVTAQAGEAGAEAARQIIADLPAGADTTPELQAALEAQSQQIAALTEKLAAVEAAGGGGGAASPELQQQLAAMQAQLEQAASAAKTQIDAAMAEAQKLQEAAASSTVRAEAVAAIAALQTALDEGGSTEPAVQKLQEAGLAAPEAVQAEVPVLQALQDGFAPAARAALKAALRDSSAEADGGTVIGNFLRAQVGARSVEPREGSDPDAVLSRADAAVQAGDLAGALTELDGLPAAAREAPEMAEWLAGAEAHVAARAALNDLAGQSN